MEKRRFDPTVLLVLVVLPILLFPLYVMIVGGLKNNSALQLIPPDLNPFTVDLRNYRYLLTNYNVARWFTNSLLISSGVCLITVFIATTAGYVFAKKSFPGKGALFAVVIATMIMPKQILLVPNYLVAMKLGLIDNIPGVILTSISSAFGVFLCRQFMQTLPDELMQAAVIDGCGEISLFGRIMLPLSVPVIGALVIFTFIGSWNDFVWQMIVISSKRNWTMPLAVASMVGEQQREVGYQFALASVSAIPMIVIFLCFQKFFIRGITMGAVKG